MGIVSNENASLALEIFVFDDDRAHGLHATFVGEGQAWCCEARRRGTGRWVIKQGWGARDGTAGERDAAKEVKESKAVDGDLNGARCSSLVAVGRRRLQCII